MGLMQSLEKRSNLSTPEKWLVEYFSGGGIETTSGATVTSTTAMRFVAVFSCISILARTVGSLPLYLYRRLLDGGKDLARNHPLFALMRRRPNPEMTAMRYRSTLQGHLASWGNAYSFIDWEWTGRNAGYPRAIWPLRPDRVQVERVSGKLKYNYFPGSDDIKFTEGFEIPSGCMLHIPGFGYDGLMGYSPISLAREAIGLGLAAEEFGARYFGTGTHPSIIFEHPNKVKDVKAFRESIDAVYQGLGKSHRTMLIEEGMKATPIAIKPEDAQFLETRKFQVAEIARLFHVPPHMIADVEKSTSWGTGIEEQNIGFCTFTMGPWFTLWEEELGRVLLMDDEAEEYFFKFDRMELLRGKPLDRAQAAVLYKRNGVINADEVRGWEDWNPIPNGLGKEYIVEKNMIGLSDLGADVTGTPQ